MTDQIKVKLTGGLGNQLFKAMSAMEFARKFDCSLIVDTSWYKVEATPGLVSHRSFGLNYFPNLDKELTFQSKASFNVVEKRIGQLRRRFNGKIAAKTGYITDHNYAYVKKGLKRYYMEGNFENWRLLPPDETLKRLLEFPELKSQWYEFNSNKLKDLEYISVHVRMGDYVNLPHIYDILTPKYYVDAIKRARETVGDLPVVLFSDNTTDALIWLSNQIKIDEIIKNEDLVPAGEVLTLQSQARAIVTAHSTFSWWSAKIGTLFNTTKCVVLPSRYFRDTFVQRSDLFVNGWIIVEV